MNEPKVVVITGSTRGIGYGLAHSFLDLGCAVVVSGRTSAAVEQAAARLASRHEGERAFGQPCDVTRFEQVEALWAAAKAHFGRVDIWINNAGIGHAQTLFWEHAPEQIEALVRTNVLGAMYGARVALRGMLEQGHGALYNLEGLGSSGNWMKGLTLYGSSKAALRYLTDAWARETRGTLLLVGALRPGMVLTDMVVGQYEGRPEEWEKARRILTILSEPVEVITPWLARKVLANRRSGVRFARSRLRLLGRFVGALFRRPGTASRTGES